MSGTHTFAGLEVSQGTYDEIRAKLEAAGYHHAFAESGAIDMHGIGLLRGPESTSAGDTRRLEGMFSAMLADDEAEDAVFMAAISDAVEKPETIDDFRKGIDAGFAAVDAHRAAKVAS